MAKVSMEKASLMLSEKKNTLILLHARPDADAIGSAFALREMLMAMGMRAHCMCADDVPHRLRFLTEGLQSSILPSALPEDFLVERVVSVDVASPSQLGALSDAWVDRVMLMIDHHQKGTPYADAWIDPCAAAAGEMVYALGCDLVARGLLAAIPQGCYTLLYAAIASDTGGFRYSNVTPKTHLCAAELLKGGFDAAAVNHALFECKERELLVAESVGFSNLRLYFDGKVALIPMSYEQKTAHGLRDEHMETLVDVARSLEGVHVAVAVRQPTSEGRFRVSMRSSGDFCVSDVCAVLGGGGHAKAAGCTVEACDVEAAIERLITIIGEQITAQGMTSL